MRRMRSQLKQTTLDMRAGNVLAAADHDVFGRPTT